MNGTLKVAIIQFVTAFLLVTCVFGSNAMEKVIPDNDDWAASQPKIYYGDFNDYREGQEAFANDMLRKMGINPDRVKLDVVDLAQQLIEKRLNAHPQPLDNNQDNSVLSGIGMVFMAQLGKVAALISKMPALDPSHFKIMLLVAVCLELGIKISDLLSANKINHLDGISFNETEYKDMCHISMITVVETKLDFPKASQEQSATVESEQCFIIEVEEDDIDFAPENDLLLPFLLGHQLSTEEPEATSASELTTSAIPETSQPTPTIRLPDEHVPGPGIGYKLFISSAYGFAQLPCVIYELSGFIAKKSRVPAKRKVKKGLRLKHHMVVWGLCQAGGIGAATSADIVWNWLFYTETKPAAANKSKSGNKKKKPIKVKVRLGVDQESEEDTAQEATALKKYVNSGLTGVGCEIEGTTLLSSIYIGLSLLADSKSLYYVLPGGVLSVIYYPACTASADYDPSDVCTWVAYAVFFTVFYSAVISSADPLVFPVGMFFGGSTGFSFSAICRIGRRTFIYFNSP